tara:strand:+ start:1605 stop:1877 length:273 start_codon:yes stop_codon:yes gene_type:complete
MNKLLEKIISVKGIVIILLLLLTTSSAGYIKSLYLDFIQVSLIEESLDLGIATVKYSFLLGLVLTAVLVILDKIIFFKKAADLTLGKLLK